MVRAHKRVQNHEVAAAATKPIATHQHGDNAEVLRHGISL